jgi:hypothetical protein
MRLFRSNSSEAMRATIPPATERRKLWEEFRNDRKTLAMLRVTAEEVNRLQQVFMLSGFTEKRQLIDALNKIRCGFTP